MTTEPISRFMARVKAANQGRSKDVRLSIEDAQELVISIGELLAAKVEQLRDTGEKQPKAIEVKVDGGSF